MNEQTVDLTKLISPRFYGVMQDLLAMNHAHYWFKGGRGSTKSSFISVMIVLMMMSDENANVVALRRVRDTLRDSVVSQLEWAISELHLSHEFKVTKTPLEIKRVPTGQKIVFRGADDPEKIKGIKFVKGHAKIIWFEEVSEFKGIEGIRSIRQTLGRGGDQVFLYSFNPPKSGRNWVNQEVEAQALRDDTMVHRSTYRTVPPQWLGSVFIAEAEALKATNIDAYRHEYLGHPVGTGAEVFTNIVTQKFTDEVLANFDQLDRGLDFGYAGDALAYVETYFDTKRRTLYVVNEVYAGGLANARAVERIQKVNTTRSQITSDREPRTINEFRELGLRIQPAKKGADSRHHGMKWLQDLTAIVIDPSRTPNAYREFSGYELKTDPNGNLRGDYPDGDDHTIDATRYANEHRSTLSKGKAVQRPKGL